MKSHKQSQLGMVGHIEILVLLVVVGVVGFAGWRIMSNSNNPATETPLTSVSNQEVIQELPTDLTDIKSIEEIKTLAVSDSTTAAIVGVELEIEEGKPVYVVHFSDGSTQAFDAKSGAKLQISDNRNDDIDDTKTLPAGFVAGISIQDAVNAAKAEQPNATVKKVELEIEDGIVVYSVRFKNGGRVDVNAADGSVVRVKQSDETSTSSPGHHGSSESSSDDSQSTDDDSQQSDDNSDDDTDASGEDSASDTDDSDEDSSGSGESGSNSGHGGSGHSE